MNENDFRAAACLAAMEGIPDPAAFMEAARGMREALEGARETFLHYAYLHGAKGTDEGREKAQANSAKAREMQAALTAFDAAMGEGQSDE